MAEAAAACAGGIGGFAIPSIVASAGNGAGGALALPASLIGDHIFLWPSNGNLTIPSAPAGYTSLGAGIACDDVADTAARCCVKKVASNGEGSPVTDATSRVLAVCVRNLDPDWIANLVAGFFGYCNNLGANLTYPALTLARPCPVLCFKHRVGTSASPIATMTEIIVNNPSSAESRAAWSAGNVASQASFNSPVPNGTSRVGIDIALYGAPL